MACAVATCKNKCGVGAFQGFKFPLNETLCKRWAENCQRENWTPTRNSILCEVHFHDSQFVRIPNGSRKLKQNAVPTIFEPIRPKKSHKLEKTVPIETPIPSPIIETIIQSSTNNADSIEDTSVIAINSPAPEPMLQSTDESNSKRTSRRRGFCYICKDVYGDDDIRLFSFPSNPKMLSLWASACNIDPERVFPGDLLCSCHFRPEDIICRSSGRKRCFLKRSAVPLPINQIIVDVHMDQLDDPLKDVEQEENALRSNSPTQQFVSATASPDCKLSNRVENILILEHGRLHSIENVPCDIEDPTPEIIPVKPTPDHWTKRPYIGDFKVSDMDNPVTARQFYDIATREIVKKRRAVHILQSKLNRYKSLCGELKFLKQKLRHGKKSTEDIDSNQLPNYYCHHSILTD